MSKLKAIYVNGIKQPEPVQTQKATRTERESIAKMLKARNAKLAAESAVKS